MASERELGHQRRHADHDRHERIEEHERSATELPHHVWKTPHVAQPDRHADDRHQPAEAGRKRLALARSRSAGADFGEEVERLIDVRERRI